MLGGIDMEEMLTGQNWFQFGAFCVLFVALFIYTIKRFEKDIEKANLREEKLNGIIKENQIIIIENQKIIAELTEKFSVLDCIQNDIKEIKFTIKK